jgi:hypothetical protein
MLCRKAQNIIVLAKPYTNKNCLFNTIITYYNTTTSVSNIVILSFLEGEGGTFIGID